MNPPAPPQISASQFPDVYIDLGIDPGNLGCIMLSVEPIQVGHLILYDDLYRADPIAHPHMQGIVSETADAHVTLLYSLLRPGLEMKKHVDAVLEGWTPQDVTIAGVDVFPVGSADSPYTALVATLELTPNLLEANARLKLLPHCETYPLNYKPHATLCYLNSASDVQGYIETLGKELQGKTVKALGLNYGD
nr:2'-5' RNA ligase family protein [Ktedonobacteraceae bacterium]